MCVHLAPRWRRRLFVLVLTYLLTADAHILRKLNVWLKTEHTDSKLTSVGKNTDSKVTLVGKNTSVGDPIVGVVTTNLTQSLTKVTDEAWNSGSKRDDSHLSTDKSVSFNNLVKSTTTPSTSLKHLQHLKLLASKRPKSMDCEGMTPCATRGKINTSDPKQGDDDNGDIDASLDKGPNNAGADISSNIKSTNDETTIQTGITNKAATLEPVLSTTLQSAPMTHAPLSTSLVAGPSDHRTQGYPSASSSAPSASKEPDSTEVLENETKSAFSTTASRSLDQTLVVVIIGVVGAIGTLVMFVSRRVLKEQDDDLDLEDSRFF